MDSIDVAVACLGGPMVSELFDPSDNSPICKIPRSNKSDVNLAVQSAQNSLSSNWGSFSSLERGRILNKIGLLVQDKIDKPEARQIKAEEKTEPKIFLPNNPALFKELIKH